jgi:hypothetical protein
MGAPHGDHVSFDIRKVRAVDVVYVVLMSRAA